MKNIISILLINTLIVIAITIFSKIFNVDFLESVSLATLSLLVYSIAKEE